MRKFFYSGDVNPEYGAVLYCLDTWKWGYVDAVRIQPASDAGGPDNVFWLERLTVNIRDGADLENILSTCGQSIDDLPKNAHRRHMLVDCHIAHGAYDAHSLATLRIGPVDPFYDGREDVKPTHIARAGINLRKLLFKLARDNDIDSCGIKLREVQA